MSVRRAAAAALVATAALAAFLIAHHGRVGDLSTEPVAAAIRVDAKALPNPTVPALHVGRPRFLSDANASMWASVRRPSAVQELPGSARIVGELGTQTPEGTTNVVLILREVVAGGTTWCEVSLPTTSAPRVGWVRRSVLGALHIVDTRLEVDLRRLRLTLSVDGVPVFHAPVGVGRPETPTPVGRFYIRDKLTRYDSPFYGPLAFGTSARSAVLTEWPAGGFIGIHGTNEPQLIPGRVSHGCIRLRNGDLLRLSRLLPIGTPVTVTRG